MGWLENATGFFTKSSIGRFMIYMKHGGALMMGLFLKINGTSSRVMAVLSNASICVSSRTVERLKKRISDDAIDYAVELAASGHLFTEFNDPCHQLRCNCNR